MKQRVDEAKRLYAVGFNILPCKQYEKRPAVHWKEWQTERIPEELFAGWCSRHTNRNWFLLTGHNPSLDVGIVVVEADNGSALAELRSRCPDTPVKQTTGRGEHWLYRHPGEGHRIKSQGALNIGGKRIDGLDIKGDSSGIMCPGSIHNNGKTYTEVAPWTVDLIKSAPVYDPSWLPYESKSKPRPVVVQWHTEGEREDLALPHAERIRLAREWLQTRKGATAGSGASGYVLALCGDVRWSFALDEEAAIELMYEWGQRDDQLDANGNHYPWGWDEIKHKVRDSLPDQKIYRGWRAVKMQQDELLAGAEDDLRRFYGW